MQSKTIEEAAHTPVRRRLVLGAVAAALAALTGCSATIAPFSPNEDRKSIVTTTGILADLARNVVGDRMDVHSIVPDGGDPHSYEPSLRDVRDIAYADAAFSNYVLLEAHSIIRTLDANLRPDVPNIALAESAVRYAAEIIPLVEDVSLDTVWLGLRVVGDGEALGASRTSKVQLQATTASGPGEAFAYVTETFGTPSFALDTSNGINDSDVTALPPDAHTHMSWAFTEAGVYTIDFAGAIETENGGVTELAPPATVTFAVGVDPHQVDDDAMVLDGGHADIALDLDRGEVALHVDPKGGGAHSQLTLDPDDVVISVPNTALHEIPGDPQYRFLGRAGDTVFQLPQAVLGAHVHGEVDPHLWHDAQNAAAYVEIIRDTVIGIDPKNAEFYAANANSYLQQLDALDAEMHAVLGTIPVSHRHLVTTHDAFAYLGAAYDIQIAGFVTPNPGIEPSMTERLRLVETLRNLDVPAVFLEPNLISRSSTLREVAGELGLEICRIYGDSFDQEVTTYIEMMRFNAQSLSQCLREG